MWYSLLLLGCKPVQHVPLLNTVGICNVMVSIIILYYNILIFWITVVYAVCRERHYAAHDCMLYPKKTLEIQNYFYFLSCYVT